MGSKLILGTMRFHESRGSDGHWVDLLGVAYDLGIRRLHCSDEYESYPLLMRALSQLRRTRPSISFEFIVKLANPHFGANEFNPAELEKRINKYRIELGVDSFYSFQWMWRADLSQDEDRVRQFSCSRKLVNDSLCQAKLNGHVKKVYCFPYSKDFASAVISAEQIDGLAIYRNPLESEYDFLIPMLQSLDKSLLVIRPFAAGKTLGSKSIASLLAHSADLQCVDGMVLSCSTITHLQECVVAEEKN